MIGPGSLWGVTARVRVGAWVVGNLDGEGLTLSWRVLMSRASSSDTADVEALNVPSTYHGALAAMAAQGATPTRRLELAIGWGQAGTLNAAPPQVIADMPVLRVRTAQRMGTDLVTAFTLSESLPLDIVPVELDLQSALGVSWSSVLALLLGEVDVVMSPEAVAAIDAQAVRLGIPTLESLSLVRPGVGAYTLLDDAMRTLHLGWAISGGVLRVYDRDGLRNDLPPIVLTPDTGLLTATEADDGAVSVTALAVPTVRPGQRVTVRDDTGRALGGGVMRIDSLVFSGSTLGDSTMALECRSLQLA